MPDFDPHRFVSTPFLGREREVTELTKMLQKPACRLVTLVGPGGIGKTRLAVEVARKLEQHYHEGVHFIDLQPVRSVDYLVSAVVDVVAPQLHGQSELQSALLQNVKNKRILLVLDNFEQLMSGVEFVSALLAYTTQIDLLVTSRRVLNLREEWLYALDGLAVPDDSIVEELQTYSAVQLFATYAQRIQHTFDLEREAAHAVRICQLVDGMPLAIEIAASWLTVLPCAVIPEKMQHSLEFLTTELHDIPERHRSIEAVLSQTWEFLSDAERHVLAALSIFESSFELDAAEYAAGSSLTVIASLVQKSLLTRQENGRYRLHPLLRQYTHRQLAQNPAEVRQVEERHCTYYTAFLYQRTETVTGPQQVTVLREIANEIENIRTAWQYMVERNQIENMERALYTLIEFLDLQGRYSEALRVLDQAADCLRQMPPSPQRDRLLAMTMAMLGYDYVRAGQHEAARAIFRQCIALLAELGEPPVSGFGTDPHTGIALLDMIAGNYAVALEAFKRACQQCEQQHDYQNGATAYYGMANAYMAQGDYDHAHDCAGQAYALTERTGNRWMMAYVLLLMGDIERDLGNLEQARHYYWSGANIRQELSDPEGVALAFQRLGRIACMEQDYSEADNLYHKSLSYYQDINDPGGLATTLHGLGDTAWAQGDVSRAVHYYHHALRIALDIQWVPLMLSILASTQRLLTSKQPERSVEVLAFVQSHPAVERDAKGLAAQQLTALKHQVHPAVFDQGVQRDFPSDDLTIVHDVLAELSLLKTNPLLLTEVASQQAVSTANDTLLDPLTDRELEVLALMTQGLTNREIAEELVVVLGTVKAHSHSIYSKLGVNNRVQAIKRAEELDLL